MKKAIATLAICCSVLSAYSQTMMNIDGRKKQSLDGQWKTIIDPYGHGNWTYW